MAELDTLTALHADPTLSGSPAAVAAAEAAWTGTGAASPGLRDWVAAVDLRLGRTPPGDPELGRDTIAAELALAQLRAADGPEDRYIALTLFLTHVRTAAFLEARRLLAAASDHEPPEPGTDPDASPEPGTPPLDLQKLDLPKQWDEAWCLWSSALQPIALAVDASPARGGEDWAPSIVAGFHRGRLGFPDSGDSHDASVTKPARQVIEKGSYAFIQRRILDRAGAPVDDPSGPAEALALLNLIEDRIIDRNGPGLARIRAMLAGPQTDIDVASIERELAVAFVKRARKYCDEAVTGGGLGSPEAIKGAWEGEIYSRVFLPGMAEALEPDGFDPDAYLADWEDYRAAVSSSDMASATDISTRLVQWNCAYQDRLGIAACTSTGNEAPAE